MNRIRRILAIMQKEFLHILRDNIMMAVAFIAPFLLITLFGYLYIQQKVTQMPVIVYDQDQTDLSRSIIRAFGESERLKILESADTYQRVEQALQLEQAYMGLVIPPHLKEDVKSGRSSQVAVILNGTNILIMNTLANTANQVIQTVSAGVTMRVLQGLGVTPPKAYQAVTALNFRTRIWFNPTTSYLLFMLVGLMGVVIQQLTMLEVALAFVKEKEQGSWKQLACFGWQTSDLVIGKGLVYFLIFMLVSVAVYGLAFYHFGIPMRGDAGLLLLATAVFLLVLVTLGMALSILAPNSSMAIEIAMLIAVPSFLISGYTWPYLNMPPAIQFLSRILPLTHFLEIFRGITLMGSGWDYVGPRLGILTLFIVVCLPVTIVGVKRSLGRKQ
jgi:ABC-2 type transport system permease protein